VQALAAIDAIDVPIFLLRSDGTVDHRNRAAAIRLPQAIPGASLMPCEDDNARQFAAYLDRCMASNRAIPGALDVADSLGDTLGHDRPLVRFRCHGAVLRDESQGAAQRVLLRLSEGDDRRFRALNDILGELRSELRRSKRFYDGLCAHAAARDQAEQERDVVLMRLYRANHDERLRLARDLHDNTGQHIAGLGLGLRQLERHVSTADGHAQIDRLRGQLDHVSQELRRIAFALRPAALDDFGLTIAVRTLVEEWAETCGILTDFQSAGREPPLASEVEITLFRVCQEALTNIVKHAPDATRVSVTVQYRETAISLTIEDNGSGCSEDTMTTARLLALKKFGIVGMRERIAMIGGTFEVETSEGGGTTLYARIGSTELAG
jgi:signal transduction histidine kinase